MITDQNMSVLHQPKHVIHSDASSVTNITDVLNHVINNQGSQEILADSIYASQPIPIVNLSHNDL